MPRRKMPRIAAAAMAAAALLIAGAVSARADSNPQSVVDNARYTLEKMVRNPELKPLPYLLGKAQAVLIVPSLLKAGFFVGGEGRQRRSAGARQGRRMEQPGVLQHRFGQLRTADRIPGFAGDPPDHVAQDPGIDAGGEG